MDKPSQVFDRDTEWKGMVRFVDHPSPDVRLGVVSGRRRQGKTYLLRALAESSGAFFFSASQATAAESLRELGATMARHRGSSVPMVPQNWDDAVEALFEIAARIPVIIDEFPYLAQAHPALPSMLQRGLDRIGDSRVRVLLCGSSMAFMGKLLSGTAPLRGRASLELVVQPFDYRTAARFWDIDDPRLAVLTHAIVGGTPAYRREFVAGDTPCGLDDFDDWVVRTVLNPQSPLFREARYLLAAESQVRDPALYSGVLAAIATGNHTRGRIASYIGRKATDLAHPLSLLEDTQLVYSETDAFHSGRARYRIAEPLIAFYEAIMRREWSSLEAGEGRQVWDDARARFLSQVVGPHFETLCRHFTRSHAKELLGSRSGQVIAGTVADPANRTQIEIDVVAMEPSDPGRARAVLGLGEAKWNKTMDLSHLKRLQRARDLLEAKGFDVSRATLMCFSGAGFAPDLAAAVRSERLVLADAGRLYS